MDSVWHLRTRSGVRRHGLASADSGRVGALTFVATTRYGCPRLLGVITGVIGYTCNNNCPPPWAWRRPQRRATSHMTGLVCLWFRLLVSPPFSPLVGRAWKLQTIAPRLQKYGRCAINWLRLLFLSLRGEGGITLLCFFLKKKPTLTLLCIFVCKKVQL